MHRAFVEPDFIDTWLKNPLSPVPAQAAKRLLDIVRVKSGEEIGLCDGTGRQIIGSLVRDSTACSILDGRLEQVSELGPQIILAQAAIQETKITETLRRGCEFGIDKFIIFPANKSEPFCLGKLRKRESRLQAVLSDAARQSERLKTPSLHFVDNMLDVIGPWGVFGDLASPHTLSHILATKGDTQADFLIVVGPEGGLSPEEMARLKAAGLDSVRWGPFTQRTELACLAAVSIFNAFCGRA